MSNNEKQTVPGLNPIKAIRIHYEKDAILSKLKDTRRRYWRAVLIIENNRRCTGERRWEICQIMLKQNSKFKSMDTIQSSSFWGNHQEQRFGLFFGKKISWENDNSKEFASPANFAPGKNPNSVCEGKIRLSSLKSNTME